MTPITSHAHSISGDRQAGPFSEVPVKSFLIVAIDYFTKWIEAKAVATITGNQVKKFVWDNIVCRFGLPGEIILDNRKQFCDNPFKDWCEKLCIRQCFTFVKHPQANGLVERANRSLGEGIKARLDERSKDWIEELPHRKEGSKQQFKKQKARKGWKSITTQESAAQVSSRATDVYYRNNEASHARDEGKLGPKWEGPYEVKESLGKGAYKLKDCKGNEIPRTWNICNLKKCYIHEV
ncbi:reverse transcriptase domain-containing protein [Tanacetum coccineum]|uniref:Reverse transcriptase domain-containing protein n=1 Tax=Tanacetum coccineum TaxID=301880 RepID=A0ABQ5GFE7_9ASTR